MDHNLETNEVEGPVDNVSAVLILNFHLYLKLISASREVIIQVEFVLCIKCVYGLDCQLNWLEMLWSQFPRVMVI